MKKRSDINQPELVKQIRSIPHTTVFVTSSLGNGFPDIICGYRGKNFLFEIKNPKRQLKNRLTKAQTEFMKQWKGQVAVVDSIESVVKILNNPCKD